MVKKKFTINQLKRLTEVKRSCARLTEVTPLETIEQLKKRKMSLMGFTDFQLRVFEETLKIPFGEVRSYGWIASSLGSPAAARAVGSALSKNPYPLLIPCHRVVKSDGALGRYSGGKLAKKKLIEFEKRLKNMFCLKPKKEI